MNATLEKPIVITPRFTCFFERAEHLFDTFFADRDTLNYDNIGRIQMESTHHTVESLKGASQLKSLRKRVRVGLLLHTELLQSIDRLSNTI